MNFAGRNAAIITEETAYYLRMLEVTVLVCSPFLIMQHAAGSRMLCSRSTGSWKVRSFATRTHVYVRTAAFAFGIKPPMSNTARIAGRWYEGKRNENMSRTEETGLGV